MCAFPCSHCQLFYIVPDPFSLVTYITVTVSGSTAVVCVEIKGAATVKLILKDARDQHYVRDCETHEIVLEPE